MSGGEFRQLSFRSQQTRLKTELNGMASFFVWLLRNKHAMLFSVPVRDGYIAVSVVVTIIMWLS